MAVSLEKTLLRPVECPGLIRLGQCCDGGYVVPAVAVEQASVLLSLGLNDEWSFDKAFLARNPRACLIGVDHSVGPGLFALKSLRAAFKIVSYSLIGRRLKVEKNQAALRDAASYFSFFRAPNRHVMKEVASPAGPGQISVSELLQLAPAARGCSVFLKMDIEGAEYQVISDILKNAPRINCIVAEFHRIDRHTAAFNEAIEGLRRDFHLVHIHGNNYDSVRFEGYPTSVEVTLLNKQLLGGAPRPSSRTYPLAGLDFPNDGDRPEVTLSFD